MPRVKLIEQANYEFDYEVRVQPQDVNYTGHVGNDNLVSLIGAARAFALHSMGVSELDLGDGETGIILTDLIVNYRSEAFLFDELSIGTGFGEIGHSRFRMFHRVRKGNRIVALAEAGFAAYSYKEKEVVPIPDGFPALLGRSKVD